MAPSFPYVVTFVLLAFTRWSRALPTPGSPPRFPPSYPESYGYQNTLPSINPGKYILHQDQTAKTSRPVRAHIDHDSSNPFLTSGSASAGGNRNRYTRLQHQAEPAKEITYYEPNEYYQELSNYGTEQNGSSPLLYPSNYVSEYYGSHPVPHRLQRQGFQRQEGYDQFSSPYKPDHEQFGNLSMSNDGTSSSNILPRKKSIDQSGKGKMSHRDMGRDRQIPSNVQTEASHDDDLDYQQEASKLAGIDPGRFVLAAKTAFALTLDDDTLTPAAFQSFATQEENRSKNHLDSHKARKQKDQANVALNIMEAFDLLRARMMKVYKWDKSTAKSFITKTNPKIDFMDYLIFCDVDTLRLFLHEPDKVKQMFKQDKARKLHSTRD
jgi:hypothetical protein